MATYERIVKVGDHFQVPGVDYEYTPTFDLLSMTPEQVDALVQDYHRAEADGYDHHIGYLLAPAAVRDALVFPDELLSTPSDSFSRDLTALTRQDFEHGRAVVQHLAESTSEMARSFAADALGHLILAGERAEVPLEIRKDLVETIVSLLTDDDPSGDMVNQIASSTAYHLGMHPAVSSDVKSHLLDRLVCEVSSGAHRTERVRVYEYNEPTFPPS